MLRRKFILVGMLMVPLLALCLIVVQRGRGTNQAGPSQSSSPHATLDVIRVSPPGELGSETECPSFAQVDFTYRIFNRGQHAISNLKLGTSCACEVIEHPPAEIPPGESAVVGFRLRAPYAGRLQRQVPLAIDGNSEPLVVLEAALRVKFDPPALIPPPQDVTLSVIKGDGSSRELFFDAIESQHSEPWVTGLELNPSDTIEVDPHRMEVFPEVDPELTRRRYRFSLTNRSLDVGQHAVAVTLRTRQDDGKTAPAIPLKVAVVDSVAIVPNPLVFKFQPGSKPDARRVHFVDRGSGQTSIRGVKCDEAVLQVRTAAQQPGSAQAFDIAPVGTSESSFDTPVVFDIGNGQTRQLLVRFEPSATP